MAEVGRRLVQVGGNRVEIEEFDVPEPGPGEVLVRVTRSQISAGSERSGFRDDAPRTRAVTWATRPSAACRPSAKASRSSRSATACWPGGRTARTGSPAAVRTTTARCPCITSSTT